MKKLKCPICKKTFYQRPSQTRRNKRHYCSQKCHWFDRHNYLIGRNNPNWKNGRHKTSSGYIIIYKPNHPSAQIRGYVMEHRLIMEKKIGRYLKPKEVVHHINGINNDNRVKNLKLISKKEHRQIHNPLANHNPNTAKCFICKKVFKLCPSHQRICKHNTCSVKCKFKLQKKMQSNPSTRTLPGKLKRK